jgi:hypothetical protein
MRPRAADLDSVPVGVPQMAGALESLQVWLENRENVAMGNIYCGSRVCKRKNVPEIPKCYPKHAMRNKNAVSRRPCH